MNQPPTSYDAKYCFEGIEMDDLLDFNEDIIQDELDFIEQPFNVSTIESYNWKIPVLLKANYQKKSIISLIPIA